MTAHLRGLTRRWAVSFETGQSAFLNGDSSCECGTLPVEETTWGGIKNLYRD